MITVVFLNHSLSAAALKEASCFHIVHLLFLEALLMSHLRNCIKTKMLHKMQKNERKRRSKRLKNSVTLAINRSQNLLTQTGDQIAKETWIE
jgi:hypothetical protein